MENANEARDEALEKKIDAVFDEAEGFKRNHGRYTLEEAAAEISERTGESAKGLHIKLMEAAKRGDLARYWPFSSVKSSSPIVRDCEEYYSDDLNEWLQKNAPRLDFKFPQPTAETIDAMVQKHGEQAGAPAPQNDALVTPEKADGGDMAKETPAARKGRLQARCNELKASSVKAWKRQTATEEGISTSMLGRILSRGSAPVKSKPGTIEALKAIQKNNNRC